MNEFENNFSIYLNIDEIIKKLNGIINNKNIYFNKEIGDLDEQSNRIIKIIKESIILEEIGDLDEKLNRILVKINESLILLKYKNIYNKEKLLKELIDLKIQIDFLMEKVLLKKSNKSLSFFFKKKNSYNLKYKEESDLFDRIISMDIDNLKLLYLYCYERLKKALNKKNNNLSIIESMFIQISLNDNADKNCEWYNFICEIQKYYKENKEEFFNYNEYNEYLSNNRNLIFYFNELIRQNKRILLENFEDPFYFFCPFQINKILIKIEEFARFLLDKTVYTYKSLDTSLFSNGDDASIKKLKEIYDTRDITLLTFYEIVLLEKDKTIDFGFLSLFKYQFLYDLQMKDTIKKLAEKKRRKINRINKKEKRLNKKLNNNISKFKTNKKDNFKVMKLSLWKTRSPLKIKKSNYYNNNYKY